MRWAQALVLRLLLEADAAVDTHQLRMRLSVETDRYWSYDRTHTLLKRMEKSGLVGRQKRGGRSVSSWVITDGGKKMVEARL